MNIKSLLFFDCEWVPIVEKYEDLKEYNHELKRIWDSSVLKWNKKRLLDGKENLGPSQYFNEQVGYYPEFNKIICISFGYTNKEGEFVTQSCYGDDEKVNLEPFNTLVDKAYKKGFVLSGYGIKKYDMPYLAKRMMINNIKPSRALNTYGVKPWDVNVYDLVEVWGQGCQKESYTAFDWVVTLLDIPTPKDKIDGSQVAGTYYSGGIETVKEYCEKDVIASYKLAKRLIKLS